MSFCYNCGVRRSPVDTTCEKCGIRFDDREHLAAAPSAWGSLILDEPPIQSGTDYRPAEGNESRSEEVSDKNSGSARPTAKGESEIPPTVDQGVSSNSNQESAPDYSNYYSGRMLDDVLSDFQSSDAELELELDIPSKDQRQSKKKVSKEMARARFEKRIREIGNFGYARLGFMNGVLYSVRVLRRQFFLRRTLRRLKARQAKAFDVAQRSLRDLGEVMFAMRDSDKMQRYRRAVQAVIQAEKEIDDTRTAQKHTRDSAAERMKKIMQEIEEINRGDTELCTEESRLQDSLSKKERDQLVFEAAIREIEKQLTALQPSTSEGNEIELRSALDKRKDITTADLQASLEETARLRDALQMVREEQSYKNSRREALHEQRRSLSQNRERTDQAFERNFEESGDARDRALRALARIGLTNKPKGIANKQITDSEVAVKTLRIANLKVEMYSRALDVYNPRVFQRGLYYLSSIAVLLIALGVGAAFTVGGSTGKQIEAYLVDNIRAISQLVQKETNSKDTAGSTPEPKVDTRGRDAPKEPSVALPDSDARDSSNKSDLKKLRDSIKDLRAKAKQRNETLKKLEKGELY